MNVLKLPEHAPVAIKPGWVTLDQLEPARCAAIAAIDAPDDDIARLMAMGVCPGRKVELVQAGDPLILRVLGSRLGVSARLARRVWADPCQDTACPTPPNTTTPKP